LAAEQAMRVQKLLPDADKNQDGKVDSAEFKSAAISRKAAGLELTQFSEWDCDKDGSIAGEDVSRFFDAAYGVRRLVGLPYRMESGIILNAMNFYFADENHDDRVSQKEYVERGFGGPDSVAFFNTADLNGDGYLDFSEWSQNARWQVNPIEQFLDLDVNLDAEVSADELEKGVPEWQLRLARYCVSGFDDDKSGALSLSEYRMVPMANMLTTWHELGYDQDGDGEISFSEFHKLRGIEIVGLAQEYFRRFDKNRNGKLDLDEFDFNIDPARVSTSTAFRFRDKDRDQQLTLDELIVDLKPQAQQPGVQSVIGLIEEAFLAADKDGNKSLSVTEFNTEAGLGTIRPKAQSGDTSSTSVKRNQEKSSGGFWALVAFNVLLVAGVGWYALFKK